MFILKGICIHFGQFAFRQCSPLGSFWGALVLSSYASWNVSSVKRTTCLGTSCFFCVWTTELPVSFMFANWCQLMWFCMFLSWEGMAPSELPSGCWSNYSWKWGSFGNPQSRATWQKEVFPVVVFNLFDLPRWIFLIRSHLRNMLQPCWFKQIKITEGAPITTPCECELTSF